jgi:Fe-S-cluster containining protein
MSAEPEYIGIDHPFTFSCNPGVGCFNSCCSDVNQFLYPYDIIRLKNALGMSSSVFLDTYTVIYSGDTTGLPIVSFKTKPENGNACPFVTEMGCGVYENRPASCRTFPLARAISRSARQGKSRSISRSLKIRSAWVSMKIGRASCRERVS